MALSVDDKTMLVDALAAYTRVADLEPDTLARALNLQDELDRDADQQLARENGLDEHPPAARYNPEHGVPLDEYAAQVGEDDAPPALGYEHLFQPVDADTNGAVYYEGRAPVDEGGMDQDVPVDGHEGDKATPREQVAQASQDLATAAQQVLKLYVFHGQDLQHLPLHMLAQLSVATQDAAVATLTALQQDPLR